MADVVATGVVAIEAKVPKLGDRKVNINYDFGATIEEAIAKFGKEVVFSNFKGNAVVTIQSGMRGLAIKGKSDAEIQAHYNTYKLGVASARGAIDPIAALIGKFPTLDPAKQDELLKKLKELQASKKR
jgi:hypothetical protein